MLIFFEFLGGKHKKQHIKLIFQIYKNNFQTFFWCFFACKIWEIFFESCFLFLYFSKDTAYFCQYYSPVWCLNMWTISIIVPMLIIGIYYIMYSNCLHLFELLCVLCNNNGFIFSHFAHLNLSIISKSLTKRPTHF